MSLDENNGNIKNLIIGIDPAFSNLAIWYIYPDETNECQKIDLLQQYNHVKKKYQRVVYEDRICSKLVTYLVNDLWDSHFQYVKYCGIEEPIKPGQARRHVIFAWLLYNELANRGITCFMVNPRSVRAWFKTSVKSTSNEKKDYDTRKEKGVECVREIWGEELFDNVEKLIKDKMDDICDAFMIARYVRYFLDDLINKTKQPYIFNEGILRRKRAKTFKVTFNNLVDPPNHKRSIVNPNKAPRKAKAAKAAKATKTKKKKPYFKKFKFYNKKK